MDHDDGVYESYHDRGNDAGTDCGQFSNLCRNSDSGTSGALIAGAGLSMLLAAVLPEVNGERMIQWGSLVLFSAAFIALRKWKLNPILVMWVCGGVSLAVKLIEYHL